MEERKIGEIFEFGGEWYQCVNYGFSCADCDINGDCSDACVGSCSSCLRKDGKQVRFKKLEKVGEPHFIEDEIFEGGKVYVQNFKVYKDFEGHKPICNDYIIYDWKNRIISIEIEQNKEDMEEKKIKLSQDDIDWLKKQIRWAALPGYITHEEDYDRATEEIMNLFIPSDTEHSSSEKIGKNLKPFDLEAAKAGKPVCTRDGRKARIICFDRIDSTGCNLSIVALIQCEGTEVLQLYRDDGKRDAKADLDLMMLPEKKEGWVNVYNHLGVITLSHNPFDTKEEALEGLKSASGRAYCIDTIKINWEE